MKECLSTLAAVFLFFACTPANDGPLFVPATSVSLDKTTLELKKGETSALKATVTPSDVTDELYWISSNSEVATVNDGLVTAIGAGEAIITAQAGTKEAVCRVTVVTPSTADVIEAVDLGLSVKWSSLNLGAITPEEYGDYFAWGETSPKENYDKTTYNGNLMSKYKQGLVTRKTVLDAEDDAAHVILGGTWRMPTPEEWWQLLSECSWTWAIRNGVNGLEVKATNGNSIFLPAAGFRNGEATLSTKKTGRYWSSSLTRTSQFDSESASLMQFDSSDINESSTFRMYGLSIRPVSK